MDVEPVLRNRGQGDHGCPPGVGLPTAQHKSAGIAAQFQVFAARYCQNSAVRHTLVSGEVRRAFRADHQCARLARDVGHVQHMVKAGMRYRDEDARLIWASITAGSEVANSLRFTKGENQSPVPNHLAYWSSIVSGRIDQNQCLPIRDFPTCSAHVSESDAITARRSGEFCAARGYTDNSANINRTFAVSLA